MATDFITEIHDLYNIEPSAVESSGGGVSVLVRTQGLGPPSFREIDSVASLLIRLQGQLGRVEGEQTDPGFRFAVGESDRTASVSLAKPDDLTAALIGFLQQTLRQSAPEWRILVVNSKVENCLAIYPDSLAFARPGKSAMEILEAIRREERQWEESHAGVRRRQMQHVKLQLKKLGIGFRPTRPVVVGAYCTYDGQEDCHAIWVLEAGSGNHGESWLPSEETDDGFKGVDGTYDVTKDLRVVPHYSSGPNAIGCLSCNCYSAEKFKGSIKISAPGTLDIELLESPALMSDEEVRRQLDEERSK